MVRKNPDNIRISITGGMCSSILKEEQKIELKIILFSHKIKS